LSGHDVSGADPRGLARDGGRELVAGRYQVLDLLGAGAMGQVYRVLDRVAGEVRALKVLIPGAGRTRFRGEFVTLVRLRHPNIVRVFDYGTAADGREYFTMELLAGRELTAAAAGASRTEVRRLVAGLVRGLRFIHGRGMIHADLKPSNVMVVDGRSAEPDGVRILDFGLAGALEAATSGGGARGSYGYAAPEAYSGRVDARSDLYSVGVILYQLLTGEHPFPGSEVVDVIRRQMRGGARDPRATDPSAPDDLAELALRLLDPEPNARYQTADEVLRVVEGRADDDEEALVHWEGAALVGREPLVARVESLWSTARDGPGQVALLAGRRGAGRTRLLAEVKLRLQLAGVRFVAGAAGPGRPFRAFAEVVEALWAEYHERYPEVFAARETELRRLIGDARGGPPIGDPGAALAGSMDGASSGVRRYTLHDAVAELLVQLSRREALVVAIDGLESADEATLEMFGYVARTVSAGRYLLLGTADEGGRPAVAALGHADHHVVTVAPLDVRDVTELLDLSFGRGTAGALAPELHRATGGVPALIEAALRALIGRGDLTRRRGRWVLHDARGEIPTPEQAVAAGKEQLGRLDAAGQGLLGAAAVLGAAFRFGPLAAALRLPEPEVADALGKAAALGLVRPAAAGEDGDFVFAVPGLREALAGALEPAARTQMALRAGEWLEAALGPDPDAAAVERAAGWFAEASDADRAYRYGAWAARLRAAVHDHRGAAALCARVAKILPERDDRLGRMLETAGVHHAALGDFDTARALFTRGATAAHDREDMVRFARRLGDVDIRRGDVEAAAARMREVAERQKAGVSPRERSRLLRELGFAELRCGRYDAVIKVAQQGLELARQAGDLALSSMHRRLLGVTAAEQGRTADAISHLEAAVEDAERGGDEEAIGQALNDLGRAYRNRGEVERAIPLLERSLRFLERTGDVPAAARVSLNLGNAYYSAGRWDLASASWERSLTLTERAGARPELVLVLSNLAVLYRDRGKLRDSLVAIDRALGIAETTPTPEIRARLLAVRAATHSDRGDLPAADEDFERATSMAQGIGAQSLLVQIRNARAQHLLRFNHPVEALDLARDALRRAIATGNRTEEAGARRILAGVSRVNGDFERAHLHLEEARELSLTIGLRFEVARCDIEEAELAMAEGNPERAQRAVERATAVFAELGAGLYLERARALRERIATESRIAGMPAGLMQTLLEVTRTIGQTLDLEPILELVLSKALECTQSERGFLILLDEYGRPTVRKTAGGEAASFGPEEASWSSTVVRQVVSSGRPLSVVDIATDERFQTQQSVMSLGLRSAFCVPMWRMGRLTGILYVDSRAVAEQETAHTLGFLEALAGQAAVAIENARLFAEERQRADVIAMLSHEINNPLGAIIGFTDLIEQTGIDDVERTMKYIATIREQGLRLMRLLKNVMAFAKMENDRASWTMADVTFADLLPAACTAMRPLADAKGVSFLLEADDDLPPAFGNADRITQVVTNLLSNAVKFTGKGSTVRIRATHERRPAPARPPLGWGPTSDPAVATSHEEDYVRVDITDQGPGIPPDKVEAIFGKFVQVDQPGARSRGVGLGLYIVKKIIKQHRGEVWAESELGKGATFSFRIPIVQA
jgi:signal transduction histidine kinase/tetratricopeptide (TPR) repeat protein